MPATTTYPTWVMLKNIAAEQIEEIKRIKSARPLNVINVLSLEINTLLVIGMLVEILDSKKEPRTSLMKGFFAAYNILKHEDSAYYMFTEMYDQNNRRISESFPSEKEVVDCFGDKSYKKNITNYRKIENKNVVESMEDVLKEIQEVAMRYSWNNSPVKTISPAYSSF